ncbi:MAG: hypothetical protein JNL72_03980 [Flavipsychrobacter sp.]|nr:hypothetical protein [Flavipsychrobacter sp.]
MRTMTDYYKGLDRKERLWYGLALLIVLAGAALRIIVWVQSRDFIIDESNIARNLYEKDFSQLAGRLSYEQYAPVLFMWIEKCFALLWGFSESALTAYPLVTGIAALGVFFLVLKEFVSVKAAWYPLAFFAFAHFFVRYSTELKQYMPDALITLSLILLALRTDILGKNRSRFILIWLVAGSLAVWSSMPSVFILTGVGAYYLWVCVQSGKWQRILLFVLPASVALAQFLGYYMAVLRSDAHSDYLQNFHADYFLVATPGNFKEWKHNWYLCSELVKLSVGYTLRSLVFNFPLLAWGALHLLRKMTAKGMLVLVPLFLTMFAAAINEFSLIPRVALFTMPLFLVLIGVGLERLLSVNKWVSAAGLLVGGVCVATFTGFSMLWKPFVNEQITWALQLMKDNNVPKEQLHLSNGSYPAYYYYTIIHPDNQRWESLKGAVKEPWDADWRAISVAAQGKFGVVLTTIPETEGSKIRGELKEAAREVAAIHNPEAKCYAYVMEK